MERKIVPTIKGRQRKALNVIINASPKKLSIIEIANIAEVDRNVVYFVIERFELEEFIKDARLSTRRKIVLKIKSHNTDSDIEHLLLWAELEIRFSLSKLELKILLETESEDFQEIACQLNEPGKQIEGLVKSILAKFKTASLDQARAEVNKAKEELQKQPVAV